MSTTFQELYPLLKEGSKTLTVDVSGYQSFQVAEVTSITETITLNSTDLVLDSATFNGISNLITFGDAVMAGEDPYFNLSDSAMPDRKLGEWIKGYSPSRSQFVTVEVSKITDVS